MRKMKKICSASLTAAIIMTLLAGNGDISFAAGKVTKEETVYVSQEADGTITEVTVTDCLKNIAKGNVTDVSNLTNIENTKGEEAFTKEHNNELVWESQGEDITYQGETDEEPPVGMTISYKLNGKSITPDKLAGESGKLTITIKYTNNATYEDEVNGKKTTLHVPFLLASVLVLPKDKFENIEISQGKLTEQGEEQLLIAYGMPGLCESLDLSGDIKKDLEDKLADTITITADVTDFELDPIYTIATSEIFSDTDIEDDGDLEDLEDALNGLADATDELISGSSALSTGMGSLGTGFSEYTKGVGKLNKGASSLASGAKTLSSGLKTFAKGASSYITGAKTFAEGVTTYIGGEKEASAISSSLKDAAPSLTSATKSVADNISTYISGVAAMTAQTASLSDDAAAVSGTINSVDYNGIIDALSDYRDTYTDQNGDPLSDEAKAALDSYITQLQNLSAAKDTAASVSKGCKDVDSTLAELAETNGAITEGTSGLNKIADNIATGLSGLDAYMQALDSYNEDLLSAAKTLSDESTVTTLTSSVTKLSKGATELSSGAKTISKGISGLDSAGSTLTTGIGQLQTGSNALTSGLQQFKEEGTGKLQNEYNDNIKTVINRFKSLSSETAIYTSFTGIADNMEGSVQFIFQTEAIKTDTE